MECRELALKAADVAMEAGKHALQEQMNPHDLKMMSRPTSKREQFTSDVDDLLIRFVRNRLIHVDPYDGFWEEESGNLKPGGRYWCVGHIDGVINYMRNMSEWTVTISLFEVDENGEGKPILGVVHAPALGVTYVAARGNGAIRIRKTPIGDKREKAVPSITPTLDGAVVSFGMSYFAKEAERALRTVTALSAGKPADIKRVGPASLDLCKVADGTYDAYFEPMLHSWDIPAVAAGAVVVWEAQGQLSQWNGEDIHWNRGNDVLATNGLITKDIQQYLV
ncbi:inositol monophosphatase family protein [Bifidobacterium vespertilionis]|uniref:Inositol monophosphatase family protein n=1 Tax=Bifidobacterium vespertilionis TaxID=2562524 RepID=A0A5J5E5H9_9BIFI|nr:inositol monophosphatase family protein [Bifidobacterium vespertilionis]KAA8822107.1 inositol monophosphatase family protein [Bifidobacterium vespertilionis]KAA8824530.1 inositol monophosphatase family protein [Bifidobacterium vespertilionis]